MCYETQDLNHWTNGVNEVVNQSSIVQYLHEISFRKNLVENSGENAVAYEN